MALKQYFYIVLVPLKFIPKRTASFWQTIKIPNRFVLKICTGGFADYRPVFTPIVRNISGFSAGFFTMNGINLSFPGI